VVSVTDPYSRLFSCLAKCLASNICSGTVYLPVCCDAAVKLSGCFNVCPCPSVPFLTLMFIGLQNFQTSSAAGHFCNICNSVYMFVLVLCLVLQVLTGATFRLEVMTTLKGGQAIIKYLVLTRKNSYRLHIQFLAEVKPCVP
jgi:hypothetical protein